MNYGQVNMMQNNFMNQPCNNNQMFNGFNNMNNQMNNNNNYNNNMMTNQNMMMNRHNQNMMMNQNNHNMMMNPNNQNMMMNQNNHNMMMNPNMMMNKNMMMNQNNQNMMMNQNNQNMMMNNRNMMMNQNNQNMMMNPNMNMMMNQNMMMYNLIQQNNNKLLYMQNFLHQQNLQNKMRQILNAHDNNLNNEIPQFQIQETEEERKEREEAERMNMILNDVAKEQLAQKQNFENLQPPQNINYDEVDPEFMHSFISDKELFCGSGHNLTGKWAHGESRGGRPYNPPDGWIGFGLNVINKYDNGNNDWLACDGRAGEWCVAFHGACVRDSSDQIKQIIKPILEQNLRPGNGQAYAGYDDACHPGQKVGRGVYCSPNPSVIDGYAGRIEVNGYTYKVAFMLRVKPDKIRYSNSQPDYWVLNAGNGDFSEMRPYRFLIKKC